MQPCFGFVLGAYMYPVDLTPEEKQFGFSISDIPNPQAHYMGQPSTVTAAVALLNADLYAVKEHNIVNGGVVYAIKHRSKKAPMSGAEAPPAYTVDQLIARYGSKRPAMPSPIPDWFPPMVGLPECSCGAAQVKENWDVVPLGKLKCRNCGKVYVLRMEPEGST